jgi:hypothetical protein
MNSGSLAVPTPSANTTSSSVRSTSQVAQKSGERSNQYLVALDGAAAHGSRSHLLTPARPR